MSGGMLNLWRRMGSRRHFIQVAIQAVRHTYGNIMSYTNNIVRRNAYLKIITWYLKSYGGSLRNPSCQAEETRKAWWGVQDGKESAQWGVLHAVAQFIACDYQVWIAMSRICVVGWHWQGLDTRHGSCRQEHVPQLPHSNEAKAKVSGHAEHIWHGKAYSQSTWLWLLKSTQVA